ncbi:MAG: hypothetical protein LBK70_01325 [Clostridiales bacterium]|jgi:hypothetical protein|nr:hypothetical protein [Clostridiales bacterium]
MKYKTIKRLNLISLVVTALLCLAMILHAEHVLTLFNNKVASATFGDVVSTSNTMLRSNAHVPKSYWAMYGDTSYISDSFDGGNGTQEDPYLISTPEQLALMAYKINHHVGEQEWLTAQYMLTGDIDMSAHRWLPVGRWENGRDFCGVFNGAGHTISNLLVFSHWDWSNGTVVGMFGVLGDQAVITNLQLSQAVSIANPELDEVYDRLSMAVVVSQVKGDATVLISNVYVHDSAVFVPSTVEAKRELFTKDVKAGIFVGWQQEGKGRIYMNLAVARMSSVIVNHYIDKSGWVIDSTTVVNSIGGLMGEARIFTIQQSSFEGTVAMEMVRVDRNMDNWRYVFAAGGVVGLADVPYGETSTILDVDVSGYIYLDTFGDTNSRQGLASNMHNNQTRTETQHVSDVRHIGSIVGNANYYNKGGLELVNIQASFVMDAPDGNRIIMQQRQHVDTGVEQLSLLSDVDNTLNGDIQSLASNPQLLEWRQQLDKQAKDGTTTIQSSQILPFATSDTSTRGIGTSAPSVDGPPNVAPVVVPIAWVSPALVSGLLLAMNAIPLGLVVSLVVGALILVVMVIIAIAVVVLTILFSVWAFTRPKWESHVHVGSAIGSEGRSGIAMTNVHIANNVVPSNTLLTTNDSKANIKDSSNTLSTMPTIVEQPSTQPVESIGDKLSLSVIAYGTIMSDGKPGVDSVLTYQWYYNTIDSNDVEHQDGREAVLIEGANNSTLDLIVDWVGARHYFVVVTNNIIEFRYTATTITARVGSRNISGESATITEQPQDITINVNSAGILKVSGQATGTIHYQWYVSTVKDTKDGILLVGADKPTFAPVHSEAGLYYYYAVLTVRSDVVGGFDSVYKDTYSAIATVSVQANATQVEISAQPATIEIVDQLDTVVLGVSVDLGTVNGNLSYQWYYNTVDSNESGHSITGATSQSYNVDTSVVGTTYYYVSVRNSVQGSATTRVSRVSQVVVTAATAIAPTIHDTGDNLHTISIGQLIELRVLATASTGGRLTYQWYENDTMSNVGGRAIDKAINPNYTVMTNVSTTKYYYVVATATTVQGAVATATSQPYSVEILDPNQKALSITTQPRAVKSVQGDKIELTVSIERRSGSTNYQWYESACVDGRDARAIYGAIGNVYRINSDEVSNKYYFVVVNNVVDIQVDMSNRGIVTMSHINTTTSLVVNVNIEDNNNIQSDGVLSVVLFVSIATIMSLIFVFVVLAILRSRHSKQLRYK